MTEMCHSFADQMAHLMHCQDPMDGSQGLLTIKYILVESRTKKGSATVATNLSQQLEQPTLPCLHIEETSAASQVQASRLGAA